MANAVRKLKPGNDVLDYFKPHEDFCRAMLDAFVVIDNTGRILKSNQLFAQLVGKKSRQILKAESIDELIAFHINESQIPVSEILSYTSPIRIDEVRGDNGTDPNMNLILGIYPFTDESESSKTVGSFVMIRDVTAETNLQDKYKSTAIKSITDPLTSLFTRGYFEDYLNLQVSALLQTAKDDEQRNITLALFDIDFFKKVNDVYGHQAGDHVLKVVAQICKDTFRKTDVCCRYGGEEFLVILPTTTLNDARVAVEKFREQIQAAEIIFEGKRIECTMSGGIAQIMLGTESYEQTISRADQALYESKKNGRNQITMHDTVQMKPAKLGN